MGRAKRTQMILALLWLAIAGIGILEARSWLGQPFPGFLVLENGVVASVGLGRWAATAGGEIYQHEVIAVNGRPISGARQLTAQVRSVPVGTPMTYRFRGRGEAFERTHPTRRFEAADFGLLFGMYLVNGLALGGAAFAIRARGGREAASRATFPVLMLASLWALTAMDLYGPYRLFRLHALCEVLLFPAILHMALAFPEPARVVRRWPQAVAVPYAVAAGIGIVYQWGLHRPQAYVAAHLVATSALGASLLFLIGIQIARYLSASSDDTRRRIRVLALGALVALGLPVVLTIAEPFTGGRAPQNALGFTAFLFPLFLMRSVRIPRGRSA